MKNILLLSLTVLFAAGIGALLVFLPMQQRITLLEKNASRMELANKNLALKVADLQKAESEKILEEKKAVEATAKVGLAYFTYTVTPLGGSKKQIDISLKGDTSLDAVDLVLTHPEAVKVTEIRKGNVFVSYPRLLDKDGSTTVTGVAMPQGNSFSYGKTGGTYATLIVETTGTNNALILNTRDTQAYYSGTPVLDFTRSFGQISL